MKRSFYIIVPVFLFSLIVSFVDAFIKPIYYVKVLIKIFFFLALPILYFVITKDEINEFKKMFSFKKEGIMKAILFGIVVYFTIVGGYFITKSFIDYSNVTTNLMESMGITVNNFIYVSIYISLMNSFLEEFFFRGFGFITLKKYTSRIFAYIFSSSLFAIYHAGMMIGSFDVITYFLLLIGLFVGGCIFNYLNEKNKNIYHSWLVHMFTNFGINTVGFILFGIL